MNILSRFYCFIKQYRMRGFSYIYNINLDFTIQQKRVLLCYTTAAYKICFNSTPVYHSNLYHSIQIVRCFISHNFSIDFFHCNDLSQIDRLKNIRYDYMIGFGKLFEYLAQYGNIGRKILFITENNPEVVAFKYLERVDYFHKRHPHISLKNDIQRNRFYNIRQYILSDDAICMTSKYNAKSMLPYFENFYYINVNGLQNPFFEFKTSEGVNITVRRKNFLWFGSNGALHKGLDILIDAFAELPNYTLNIYGFPDSELHMLKPLLKRNTIVHNKIDVFSKTFIDEVVNQNLFVLSASCSEGMQSGVATCMLHGLIPILTKETGYEDEPFIYHFYSYKVEDIVTTIKNIQNMADDKLIKDSKSSFEYAQEKYTIKAFSSTFDEILNNLV